MLVYRIARGEYATDLSGEGARLTGGRFNSEGTALLYTSSRRSLSVLEVLVHARGSISARMDFHLLEVELPEGATYESLAPANLIEHWRDGAPAEAVQALGDAFVARGQDLLLRVPSVVVPEEWNYLINPGHASAAEVRIVGRRPIVFDPRLGVV